MTVPPERTSAPPSAARQWWPLSERSQVGLIIILAFVVRVVALTRWPEIETDEGLWTLPAKNLVRYGNAFIDGNTHALTAPVFHVLAAAIFTILSPSIWAARLISAVAGALSTWLLVLLVRQTTRRFDVALIAALLFATSEWLLMTSRRALVEPLQLAFALAAAVLVTRRTVSGAISGGIFFAMCLLTKVNAAILGVVFAAYLLVPEGRIGRGALRERLGQALLFGGISLTLAGAVLLALYLPNAGRFVAAYRFEMDGVHFESLSHPIVRLGRFGIDPVQIARTMIELVREEPFLLVLALVGLIVLTYSRPRGSSFFVLWLALGLPYFLFQMYQPLRYLYLLSPAFVLLAAQAVAYLGETSADVRLGRGVRQGVLTATCLLGLAYSALGAMANPARRLERVVPWARAHVPARSPVMASPLFCTDVPQCAYGYYRQPRDSTQLLQSIRSKGIELVIVDHMEWPASVETLLTAHYPIVMRWDEGVVFRTLRGASPGEINEVLARRTKP